MTIAEKLSKIYENMPKVYYAGYKAGVINDGFPLKTNIIYNGIHDTFVPEADGTRTKWNFINTTLRAKATVENLGFEQYQWYLYLYLPTNYSEVYLVSYHNDYTNYYTKIEINGISPIKIDLGMNANNNMIPNIAGTSNTVINTIIDWMNQEYLWGNQELTDTIYTITADNAGVKVATGLAEDYIYSYSIDVSNLPLFFDDIILMNGDGQEKPISALIENETISASFYLVSKNYYTPAETLSKAVDSSYLYQPTDGSENQVLGNELLENMIYMLPSDCTLNDNSLILNDWFKIKL